MIGIQVKVTSVVPSPEGSTTSEQESSGLARCRKLIYRSGKETLKLMRHGDRFRTEL